jgi:hypothetical protein
MPIMRDIERIYLPAAFGFSSYPDSEGSKIATTKMRKLI